MGPVRWGLVASGCRGSQPGPQPAAFVAERPGFVNKKWPPRSHRLGPLLLHLPRTLDCSLHLLSAELEAPIMRTNRWISSPFLNFAKDILCNRSLSKVFLVIQIGWQIFTRKKIFLFGKNLSQI